MNPAKKRDRLEVVFDILKIIRDNHNSILPTPLLRKSNLSSNSFSEYYKDLISKEFIIKHLDYFSYHSVKDRLSLEDIEDIIDRQKKINILK